jgi:hypothetical protein
MSAAMPWRLWGRDADYALSEVAAPPEGALPALPMPHAATLRDLLRELVELYPGNLDILREAMQRTPAAVDSDPVDVTASRVAEGLTHLWRFPHARLHVPTDQQEIPWLADLAERQSASEVTTWIEVRVVDQYGRPLPWMRPRLGLPDGRAIERALDADARTHADRLPQSGMCWLELRAEKTAQRAEPFVDAVEPPRPVDVATWFGIRVVDQFGRALPWMKTRVTLPDGSERQPLLSDEGAARVDSVLKGACSIELQATSRGAMPS